VTHGLLAGEVEISHRGLDEAAIGASRPVAFVRAALVDCGVLEPRAEHSERFAAWHARTVLEIPEGPDRAHVRAMRPGRWRGSWVKAAIAAMRSATHR